MTKPADQVLTAEVRGGRLVISIGVNLLANALELGPELSHYDEATGEWSHPKVTDAVVFAREIAIELEREEEDGTTPVHRMLDAAALKAIESGALGIRLPGD